MDGHGHRQAAPYALQSFRRGHTLAAVERGRSILRPALLQYCAVCETPFALPSVGPVIKASSIDGFQPSDFLRGNPDWSPCEPIMRGHQALSSCSVVFKAKPHSSPP